MEKSSVMLNADSTARLLEHMYNNNKMLVNKGQHPVSIEIQGEAGIGKTSVIRDFAKKHNMEFVKLQLSQLEEISDLVGFPLKQFEMSKNIDGEDKSEWVNDTATTEFAQAGYKFTGRKRMSYAAPEWIAGKEDKDVLLLLDDWTRADPRFITASMELINEQSYMSWKLPKNTLLVLSANPDNGNYNVNSQDSAQATRYISVNMKWDVDCWARWAEHEGIDGRAINFLLLNSEVVTKNENVNARAITMFFKSIASIEDYDNNENLALIRMLGDAAVGSEVSQLFATFITNKLDKLITPKDMMTGEKDRVFKMIKSSIGDRQTQGYRADIASVLCTRALNYTAELVEKGEKIDDKYVERVIDLISSDLFTNDLQMFLSVKIFAIDNRKFTKMLMNPTVRKHITKS